MYTLAHAARILRVSPSRLRYWKRTALLRTLPPAAASAADAAGAADCVADAPAPRAPEHFEFRDLVEMRALLRLIENGFSTRQIRQSLDAYQRRARDEAATPNALHMAGGAKRLALRRDDAWEEPDGQLLFEFALPKEQATQPELVMSLPKHAVDASGARDGSTLTRGDAPETALAWFERGCELDQDPARESDALAAYRRALALDPAFADAHCNLGTVYYGRSERAQARRAYERALELDPDHLEAHFNLGSLLEEAGQRRAALHHYEAAVRIAPFFGDARLNLALLCEKLELPQRALEQWRHYLQCAPEGHWADLARERLARARQD